MREFGTANPPAVCNLTWGLDSLEELLLSGMTSAEAANAVSPKKDESIAIRGCAGKQSPLWLVLKHPKHEHFLDPVRQA